MIKNLNTGKHAPQSNKKHVLAPTLTHVRLKEIRELLGLDQKQMAAMLDYSYSRYRFIEQGNMPKIPLNLRLAIKPAVLKYLDDLKSMIESEVF